MDVKKGFRSLREGLDGVLSVGILIVIGIIVMGVLIGAVTGGDIALSSGFNTVLNDLDTTMSGWFTTLTSTAGIVVGLVLVVVVLAFFGGWIGKGKKSPRKAKRGGDFM